MRKVLLLICFSVFVKISLAQNIVSVLKNQEGMKLLVDDKEFMVNGMNWDYFPIGTNFNYSLWNQPDDIVMAALDAEMALLQNMGVNSVRIYTGVPKKWITYIYENYGIYTMLNHAFGRYGLTIDGGWQANTDYADPRVKKLLMDELTQLVKEYKNTPGLLMYLLGNENNYGLFWEGAETEDIPVEQRKSTQKAIPMYKLFNEVTVAMKELDATHPVAICNGDLLFLDIIKEECKDIDIFGTNMYRGVSFTDAFTRVEEELNMPILFTEFGADAFNVINNAEDQESQAYYLKGNWKEIYENASGLGKAGNSIGGYTFQFSDGWWKYGQTTNLDVHDNNASWVNGGYDRDFTDGDNNMNEEWFGIAAKGPTDERGLYQLYPRAAYYMLKEAHQLDPYGEGVTLQSLNSYFENIQIASATIQARADKVALLSTAGGKLSVSHVRAEFSTFSTGGNLTTTPDSPDPNNFEFPDQQGFDNMESFYFGVEAKPTENIRAEVSFNVLGNVARNPIDQIFFENRGLTTTIVNSPNGPILLQDENRLQVYQASYSWNHEYFNLEGFYRTGHYHWGYEGDFFGLYPEANYGENLDIYNGLTPNGFEIEGKKAFKGLKLAFGRELWWAALPAVLLKYNRKIMGVDVTGIFHEDIADGGAVVTSGAVPQPRTRRLTLHLKKEMGNTSVELGGIWGGQPLVGREFQVVRGEEGAQEVLIDEIRNGDTWGGKVKLTHSTGPWNFYAQAASLGLVARGGADPTITFTGWRLKANDAGNQNNVAAGFTYNLGRLQIAPNFLLQRPMVDPIPGDAPAPARLRNILDDPFAVRESREMTAGELLLTFDLTPGTWFYDWDSDNREDAKLALSLGFIYRDLPTSQDAGIGILDTREVVAFPGAAPARNLWEIYSRIVTKLNPETQIITNIYGGPAQANGDSDRTIDRFGIETKAVYKKLKVLGELKFNDWGPYDFHRDFNLTFPEQYMLDVSTFVGQPDWFAAPNMEIGARLTWRSLNQFSPRYVPATAESGELINDAPPGFFDQFDNGNEWEIRTYVRINVGK
ncbi:MAG: glycoside hydrolase family 2 TIM barrel-domain containing protein [Bacteroidota bacterium]